MARLLSKPYVDSPITGDPKPSLSLAKINYPVDFAVMQDTPGEVVITNLTCSTDRPEKIRFASSPIQDVYKGSGIDPNLYTPSRRGTSVLVQLTDVYTLSDSTDSTCQAAIPLSGHIVLRIPNEQLLTGDMVKEFLARLVDGMFSTGVVTSDRLEALLRGSLRPKGL